VKYTADELDRMINEAGVVCGRVYCARDIAEDPFFEERGLLVEVEDEVHGSIRTTGVVPKLSATPGMIRRSARWTVGADTEVVLASIGVDPNEVASLRARGIV
jgi:crotonobetainyl-CoA:carnitine CoA-transferase CaiB-like acyl-CoA transferase